jgi:uncharacterized membrane protein
MLPPSREPRRIPWDAVLAVLALAAILVALLAPPHGLLDKADRAAFAVCHRLPERTFHIAGRALPLCARCSGTYLGTIAGLAVLALRGRGRASGFPRLRDAAILALFLLAWAGDGANSFLALLGLPHLYEPHNLLRLVTGALEGLAIASFILPVANLTLWAAPEPARSIETRADLAWLLVGAAVVVALVSSELTVLLYPLALLSGLTIVGLFGLLNGMLVLMLLRREARATRWRPLLAPLLLGVALALGELAAIGAVRDWLTARFGLPF